MNDDEQIRARAYSLWEQQGRPEGAAERFWQQAQDELQSAQRQPGDESQSFSGGIESSVAPPMPKPKRGKAKPRS